MAVDDLYSKLLLHMDGADNGTTFTDEAGNTVTSYGNTCTKTAQKAFGTASAYFDGNGDYLVSPANDDFAFGTGEFTVDFWIRFATVATVGEFLRMATATDWNYGRFVIYYQMGSLQAVASGGANPTVASWTPTVNTWYHMAITRDSLSKQRIFINGVKLAETTCTNNYSQSGFTLSNGYSNRYFNGYMDEIRISKGVARWTANFTPPTEPYGAAVVIPEGGSTAIVYISVQGAGTKIVSGGSTAAITVSAQASGQSAVIGYSTVSIVLTVLALGIKQARAPPSDSDVSINASGGGTTVKSGGSESIVSVSAQGQGIVIQGLQGGSEAGVSIDTLGAGSKIVSGGSESGVSVSSSGSGIVNLYAQGGSESSVVTSVDGQGTKIATLGKTAVVFVLPQGIGSKTVTGGRTSIVRVITTGSGRNVIRKVIHLTANLTRITMTATTAKIQFAVTLTKIKLRGE